MTDQNDKQLPLFQIDVENIPQAAPDTQIGIDQDTPFGKYIVYVAEKGLGHSEILIAISHG